MNHPDLYIPLIAAMLFPLSAMALKKAMDQNRNPYSVLLVSNLTMGLAFLPFFLWKAAPSVYAFPSHFWQPVLAAILFSAGQMAAFKSFQGDISIAIPAQGTKVLLVALLAMLFLGQHAGIRLWLASGLSVAAIYLLRDPGEASAAKARKGRETLVYAGLASLAFAAFDLSVQEWTPHWGMQRFGPWVFLLQGGFSLALLLVRGSKGVHFPSGSGKWLALGSLSMAGLTVSLVVAIGILGKATQMNLLLNSRCVWSVVSVWFLGKWFGNREANCGKAAMTHRMEGAGLMLLAIVIALV